MVPPKSSPNELAFTITRYRKSKLSSLAEKFTRRSPSLGPASRHPFRPARQFTEVILIFRTRGAHGGAYARARAKCTRVCVCVRSADIERDGEVSENYTLLLFSTLYKSLPSKHLRASFHPCFQRAMVRSLNRRSRRSYSSVKGSTESILDE